MRWEHVGSTSIKVRYQIPSVVDPELKFRVRIQQKVKDHINRTVNSVLFVLLDSTVSIE